MKYIIDQDELEKIRQDCESSGYNSAEQTLNDILHGRRDLFIAGETRYDKAKPISELPEYSVWRRLIEALDNKK